jgi:integrase
MTYGTPALCCYSLGISTPQIVSEMLGHATIAITLDTYSHVLPNMQTEAAKAMEDALS